MEYKDPVCGMTVTPQSAFAKREYQGQSYYFCSQDCADKFDAAPQDYVHEVKGTELPQAGSATTGFNPELSNRLQVELPIPDLDCVPCVRTVEGALSELKGVEKAHVNFTTTKAHVTYDPKLVSLADMQKVVKKAGYTVGEARAQIGIQDLRCASCVHFIEENLRATPGVTRATVNILTGQADVAYIPGATRLGQLRKAIEAVGYRTEEQPRQAAPEDAEQAARRTEYLNLRNRFIFAAVLAAVVFLLTFAEFIPFLNSISRQITWMLMFVLTTPVLAWAGQRFFVGAWSAFRHRSADMNTLIALGTGAAYLYSTVATFLPGVLPEALRSVYFDTTSIIIALILLESV